MWTYLRKRRAIRRYRRVLGPKLRRRYGRERHYTAEQVRTTAVDSGMNTTYLCYAYAMYCDREAFDAHHLANGETCDYVAMRSELGVDSDATSHEVIDSGHGGWSFGGWFATSDSSSDSSDCGGGFDGGGFDGGGCGGDGGGD